MRWQWDNTYTTTIHAINSVVVKMSRLSKIKPLYRGWTDATLPKSFFEADGMGVKGGVEYGFSSTTTDRAQAVHYAEGKASTVLQLVMGMIDRGADISWLSQYPHERETLLPPLMGLQVRQPRPSPAQSSTCSHRLPPFPTLAGAFDGRGGQHARRPVQLLHQHGLAHARAGGGQAP